MLNHPEQARALLSTQPQLAYALFQALLVNEIVDPTILRVSNEHYERLNNNICSQPMLGAAEALQQPSHESPCVYEKQSAQPRRTDTESAIYPHARPGISTHTSPPRRILTHNVPWPTAGIISHPEVPALLTSEPYHHERPQVPTPRHVPTRPPEFLHVSEEHKVCIQRFPHTDLQTLNRIFFCKYCK